MTVKYVQSPDAGLAFDDVDVPAGTRSDSEPNPFLAVIADLAANGSDKAKAFTLPDTLPTFSDKGNLNNRELLKVRRQLTEAGSVASPRVTVRSKLEEDGRNTKVTFWCVPKIAHRTPDEIADAAKAEVANLRQQ